MYVTENRITKLLAHEMKQLVKVYNVNMLPKVWNLLLWIKYVNYDYSLEKRKKICYNVYE